MAATFDINDIKRRMQGAINALKHDLNSLRTGRASPEIGARMGEDKMVTGQGQRSFDGAMTPDAAKAEITRLRGDNEFVRRYVAGDADSRLKMERLHRWAYGEGSVA